MRRAVTAAILSGLASNALALPLGMTVQRGNATLSLNGSTLTVNAGNNAVLNWSSFNIGNGETTVFNQPSASSIVWNRINDQNPSQIYGSLQANGVVVLLNSSGFYFGPNSFVSAAGLVVSTANCLPPQNSGGSWVFNGPPPLASIVNYGQIKIGNGGDCFFIADQIENHGRVETAGGTIGFAAGQSVTLSERPDGRGMSMSVTLPQGSVDNYGNIIANGGTIALNAKVVNQGGWLQANSVRNQNGVIELVASDAVNLTADSTILAQGDDSATGSAGGTVTIKSDNVFSDAAGSRIMTTGGSNGGNGGTVEVSAANIQSLETAMDARAVAGWLGGEFLLDPVNIILGTSGAGSVPANGTVGSSDSGNGALSGTLTLNVNTAFANKNFSNIKLQATQNITLAAGTTWDLSASTGVSAGQLTLQAGGDIIFGDKSKLVDANNWSVSLQAGYSFINNSVTYGTGNIYFGGANNGTGSGSLQLASGAVNLQAGNTIQVGAGSVTTIGGGSIQAQALKGKINTGSSGQGYFFRTDATSIDGAYDLSHGLGGISTAAGGNVTLIAGGDITSVLPGKGGYYYNGNLVKQTSVDNATAGSGAYGPQAGNVTLIAGGNVTGNYVVANGVGSIYAGVLMNNGVPLTDGQGKYLLGTTGNAGTSQNLLALNLIKGGWNVTAARDINLQEVRNPNGVFNVGGSAFLKHLFNYAADDYVNLAAGNAVQLGGNASNLPRLDTMNVPIIYPGILNVTAGAGGVSFVGDSVYSQLILFPTALGALNITTLNGGGLISKLPTSAGAPQLYSIVVSDSGRQQYVASGNFGINDHAATPVHLNSENPVRLNITGDMKLVQLAASEAAEINVVGNMSNCRFQGMNLDDADVTTINIGQAAKTRLENLGILNPATDGSLTVGGDIYNRSAFTSINLDSVAGSAAPDLSVLGRSLDGNVSSADLINSLYYNPDTHVFTYQNITGVNINTVLNTLQNLTVQKVDASGNLLWLDAEDTIPATEVISVINSATAAAMLAQYNALGAVPGGSGGYFIGGGGTLEINARNMDLGTSAGIQSKGIGLYSVNGTYPLAKYFTTGADIDIHLTGNLDMYSTSIASLNGGDISVYAGGDINAGSADYKVTSTSALGIFSTAKADVLVIAGGDINVNGSRIAAYDGGNVTAISLNGDINAGSGGTGFTILNAFYVDPATRQAYPATFTIPGSGILAATFPTRDSSYPAPENHVGNILVETPNGNVNASAGGVIQLALNKQDNSAANITVLAGYALRDAVGQLLTAADLGRSAVQGSLAAAADGDAPQTVVVGSQRISVSDAIWAQLQTFLGVTPAANQVIECSVFGDGTGFISYLQGGGSDIGQYAFVGKASAGRNIDATGSGVIGYNVNLQASGDLKGIVFARNNANLNAQQNANVTVLAQGNVTASVGGNLSGTIIGVSGVTASGSSVDASVLSQNANVNGGTSGDTFAAGTAANAASQGLSGESNKATGQTSSSTEDEDDKKKKKNISLAAKVSRVTVILPPKRTSMTSPPKI